MAGLERRSTSVSANSHNWSRAGFILVHMDALVNACFFTDYFDGINETRLRLESLVGRDARKELIDAL